MTGEGSEISINGPPNNAHSLMPDYPYMMHLNASCNRNLQKHNIIYASACDFQQSGILTGVDSDEPLQPPFKLRNTKWCSVSSLTIIE